MAWQDKYICFQCGFHESNETCTGRPVTMAVCRQGSNPTAIKLSFEVLKSTSLASCGLRSSSTDRSRSIVPVRSLSSGIVDALTHALKLGVSPASKSVWWAVRSRRSFTSFTHSAPCTFPSFFGAMVARCHTKGRAMGSFLAQEEGKAWAA